MAAGSPFGAPLSTHLAIVAISSSDNDTSLLKCCTPTFLSMNHGGISRVTTFCLIDFAHGRVSWYVISDIGANVFGRWQTWHRFWSIVAMSFVKVTWSLPACAFDDSGGAAIAGIAITIR